MLYLIHFKEPFAHARHYLGYSEDEASLSRRLDHHRRGTGANLMRHVSQAGIEWWVTRIWPEGDRNLERKLKGHSSTRLCPEPSCGTPTTGYGGPLHLPLLLGVTFTAQGIP